jgi:hypothetical protein
MANLSQAWQRFLGAIEQKPERKAAYGRLVAAVRPALLHAFLKFIFSATVIEQKQAKFRAAVEYGRKLQKQGYARATMPQVKTVERRFRAGLQPENQILLDCALPWHTRLDISVDRAIEVYEKHSSKKQLGSLKSRDCYLVLFVTCLEMATGRSHYDDVAQILEAMAVASRTTDIPCQLDGHLVAMTVARFKDKFNQHYVRVIQPRAAKYIRNIRRQS